MACHPRQRKREGPDGDKWSKTTKDTLGGMESERVPTEPSQTSPHHQILNIKTIKKDSNDAVPIKHK